MSDELRALLDRHGVRTEFPEVLPTHVYTHVRTEDLLRVLRALSDAWPDVQTGLNSPYREG